MIDIREAPRRLTRRGLADFPPARRLRRSARMPSRPRCRRRPIELWDALVRYRASDSRDALFAHCAAFSRRCRDRALQPPAARHRPCRSISRGAFDLDMATPAGGRRSTTTSAASPRRTSLKPCARRKGEEAAERIAAPQEAGDGGEPPRSCSQDSDWLPERAARRRQSVAALDAIAGDTHRSADFAGDIPAIPAIAAE